MIRNDTDWVLNQSSTLQGLRCAHLWTERLQVNNYFLVFIWINYIDLSHLFLYIKHRVLESSARIKESRKRKTNKQKNKKTKKKTIQRQSCAAQRIPPFTLLLDNILYIYIYTVCVYFCHSYKNKIRYCRCATIHTKVKTKHRKAVQSSLRAKIHTIVKKKVKERKESKRICIAF